MDFRSTCRVVSFVVLCSVVVSTSNIPTPAQTPTPQARSLRAQPAPQPDSPIGVTDSASPLKRVQGPQQSRIPCICKDEPTQEVYCAGAQYGSCRLDDNDKCQVTCKPIPDDPLALATEVLATITEEKPDLRLLREQRQKAIPLLKSLLDGKTKEGAYNITYDADDMGFCLPERAVALLKEAITKLEAIDKPMVHTPCSDLAESKEPFVDNGVVVGQTKLFDERSLRLMLEAAEDSLRKISAVDSAKLAQATGTIQGQRLRESSLGVKATTLPGVILGSDNDPPPSPTIVPGGSEAPAQTSGTTFQPSFGISSQDLLAEQMSLNYQIINLRMLLERSISDRLYIEKGSDGSTFYPSTRAQAIVGFQISLDPRSEYKNAVAEVDISISSDCDHPLESPSLVSLLPRDKTYNVATLSKDAKSFGLGAVVQFLDLGVTTSGKHEALYLVRDTDTVALERTGFRKVGEAQPVQQKNTLTFGWQFRPVLGRKAVEPGTRQVYAMLSLPTDNRFATPYDGYVEVRTRWRRFDAKTNTIGGLIKGSESYFRLKDLEVRSGGFHEHILGPQVTSVTWNAIGNGTVMVKVRGTNFLTGTMVVMGDTVLDRPESGLFRQGENFMMFKVAAEKLAQVIAPAVISRYGPAVELRNAIPARIGTHLHGITVDGPVTVAPADAQNSTVKIRIKEKKFLQGLQEQTDTPQFSYKPVVFVGGRAFGLGDNSVTMQRVDGPTFLAGDPSAGTYQETHELSFTAPNTLLREAGAVKIVDLFYGEEFAVTVPISLSADDFTATELVPLTSNDAMASYAVRGTRFNDQKRIKITVGSKEFCFAPKARAELCAGLPSLSYVDTTLLSFSAKPETFKGVKNILIAQGDVYAVLPLPAPPAVPVPVIEKADEISEGDLKTITLKGTDLGSIETIKFLGDVLKIKIAPNGKSLTLTPNEALTAKAGDKELQLHLKNGMLATYNLSVEKRG